MLAFTVIAAGLESLRGELRGDGEEPSILPEPEVTETSAAFTPRLLELVSESFFRPESLAASSFSSVDFIVLLLSWIFMCFLQNVHREI